jgi:hypothetical protein
VAFSVSVCLPVCMHACVCALTHRISCLPAGVLSDMIGRKLSTFGASALAAIFTAACIGATNYWVLLALRLVTGGRRCTARSMPAVTEEAHNAFCIKPHSQSLHATATYLTELQYVGISMAVLSALLTQGDCGCCVCCECYCRHWCCRPGPGCLPAEHRDGGTVLERCGWHLDAGGLRRELVVTPLLAIPP